MTRFRGKQAGLLSWLLAVVLSGGMSVAAGNPPAQPTPPADTDDLYKLGQQLFEEYAPPEVKAEYEFPSKPEWDAFMNRLQTALQADSLEDLAAYAPQARAALTTLRGVGADPELADWLEQRLDEIEGAGQVRRFPSATTPRPPAAPVPRPSPKAGKQAAGPRVPYYDLWIARVQARPVPTRAAELMPVLRRAFTAEGVPAAVAWLAEAESSFNPAARSPAGAKGLFQLMPDTARNLGLDTFLPDERTSPEKSAHAAAKYLRELRTKFGDWPLAFAAYNAGEGRVSRALAARKAKDFAAIADALPAETRMYVPKVCALVAVRSGTSITAL